MGRHAAECLTEWRLHSFAYAAAREPENETAEFSDADRPPCILPPFRRPAAIVRNLSDATQSPRPLIKVNVALEKDAWSIRMTKQERMENRRSSLLIPL